MADTPLFVLVSGPPGSGKTTLAARLADRLSLRSICKDAIKERLFDTLGYSDREWSQKLGRASFDLVFELMRFSFEHASPCSPRAIPGERAPRAA